MNIDAVLARPFPPVRHAWDTRDAALYALSLGAGADPVEPVDLPLVYEGAHPAGLQVLPTFALTLGWPPFWHDDPIFQIDWPRILHGEHHVTWHASLTAAGCVVARHRILAIEDKGPGRGALIHFEISLDDADTGRPVADIRQVQFLRGDGGCGSWGVAPAPCEPLDPASTPDDVIDIATPRNAALLYRLASRDLMPLHADPTLARAAGFDRPISHGLNNLGIAVLALLRRQGLPSDATRLRCLSARFVNPGYPGETVRVELFGQEGQMAFRARALERDLLLIDRGRCGFA